MNIDRATSLEHLAQIDRLADAFELAWASGERPDIFESVARSIETVSPGLQNQLISDFIKIDFEYRTGNLELPQVDEYLMLFPQLKENPEALLDQLIRDLDHIRIQANSRSANVPPGGDADKTVGLQRKDSPERDGDDLPAMEEPQNISTGGFSNSEGLARNPNTGSLADSWPSQNRMPQVLGRFRLLEQVGEGAFGIVFKAIDVQLNRVVAIKKPKTELMASDPVMQRFVQEARAAAKMNHPGILKVFDIVFQEKTTLIVTEFLEGASLKDVLDSPREFTAQQTANIILQLAEALHYAHRCGLIHRDIKPSNIFICDEDHPVILDFGIARIDVPDTLTATGQILGTPAYMSPEQASGQSHHVDARSDVYSLGIVMYELLAGEQPFRGSPHHLVEQVLKQDPLPPSHFRNGIAQDLETICLKAIEKIPSMRYDNASDFADDIRRFLESRPILARPLSRINKVVRWCRRNPRIAILTSVIVLGMWLATLGATITSLVISDMARIERQLRGDAQAKMSRSLAERGIQKLQNGDSLGLLDILHSMESVLDNPDELKSRQLLAGLWAREFEGQLETLVNHTSSATMLQLSPSGIVFAVGTMDGAVQLWETETGRSITPVFMFPKGGYARQAMFSPDGGTFVAFDHTKSVLMYDLVSATGNARMVELPGRCTAVGFNSDSEPIAAIENTGIDGQTELEVWNVADFERIEGPIGLVGNRIRMEFNSNASLLAVGSSEEVDSSHGATVMLLDTASGEVSRVDLEQDRGDPIQMTFSPDGNHFAIAWSDNSLTVFDRQIKLIRTMVHHENIKDVAFSPDGRYVATATFDSRARIWNLDEPQQRELVLSHDGPVLTLGFNRDGTLLATGGFDMRVRVWSATTGELTGSPFNHQDVVSKVLFHPFRDDILSTSNDLTTRVWKQKQIHIAPVVISHSDRVWSVDFSNDGRSLLTTAEEGLIHTWNVADGTPIAEPIECREVAADMVCARFNPINNDEVVMSNLNNISFWSLNKRCRIRDTDSFRSYFRSTHFSRNGQFVISGTDTAQVWLFDLKSEQIQAHVIQHPGVVNDVTIHPGDKWFATAGQDGFARIWQVDGLKQLADPLRHNSMVESIAFSPDGRYLATASRDLSIRIWRTSDWSQFGSRIPLVAFVQSLAFSPDGLLLASASSNGLVQLWDVQTGLPVGRPFAHEMFATAVAFSPDGTRLATGSFDKTARIWDLDTELGPIDREHLQRRIWRALGARTNETGDVLPVNADDWNQHTVEFDENHPGIEQEENP